MKQLSWMVLAFVLVIAQTAFVKEKIKKISAKQLFRLDNFYMSLQQDRNPDSKGKSKDPLQLQYEKLYAEYARSLEEKKAQETDYGAKQAISGSVSEGGGEALSGSATKAVTSWASQFANERLAEAKAPVEKKVNKGIQNFMDSHLSGPGARNPASVNVTFERSSVSYGGVKYILENSSRRSDLQIEFGEKIRNTLGYQVDDNALTWSLSTQF